VVENSHHDPVYDIRWITSRSGSEFVSVSSDGRLLWWDTRNLKKPVDSSEEKEQKSGYIDSYLLKEGEVIYGGTSLGYKTEAGATKTLVGTEQGHVLYVDRKAKKDADSTKTMKVYGRQGSKHHGPIRVVERNPVHPKYFLTIGDWSAKVKHIYIYIYIRPYP